MSGHSTVKVTLSNRNQAILRARLKSGPFKTADEVVNHIIENYMLEVGYTWEEMEALLISLDGPKTPYHPVAFEEMVMTAINEADENKSS